MYSPNADGYYPKQHSQSGGDSDCQDYSQHWPSPKSVPYSPPDTHANLNAPCSPGQGHNLRQDARLGSSASGSSHLSVRSPTSSTAYSPSSWNSTPTLVHSSIPSQHQHRQNVAQAPSLRLRTLVKLNRNDLPLAYVNVSTTSFSHDRVRADYSLDVSPVTDPAVPVLKIKFGALILASAETINVVASASCGVTLRDIKAALYHFLRRQITQADFMALPSQLQLVAGEAFGRRTARDPGLYPQGMIRLDVLGESLWLVGLQPSSSERGAFEPLLSPNAPPPPPPRA